jgi:hypothetical protein
MKAPGIICLLLCVSVDAVKGTEEFSGQMLALLFITHTAVSVVDVDILSAVFCRWCISNMSTFHELQHCITSSAHKYVYRNTIQRPFLIDP